jgi:hypothetical protein
MTPSKERGEAMEYKKILVMLLCVMFCFRYAAASEKDPQSETKSDGSISEQSVLPEDQATESPFGKLAGRSRIGASFGFRSGSRQSAYRGYGTTIVSGAEHLTLGFGYAYWLREDLTLNLSMSILAPEVGVHVGPVSVTTNGVVAALAGVRWYPPNLGSPTVKPYVTASLGPYIGSGVEVRAYRTKTLTVVSPGGHVGGGLDIQFHRDFILGVRGGYNFMSDFSQPLAGRDNFSGFEMGVEISWVFGQGKPPASARR